MAARWAAIFFIVCSAAVRMLKDRTGKAPNATGHLEPLTLSSTKGEG